MLDRLPEIAAELVRRQVVAATATGRRRRPNYGGIKFDNSWNITRGNVDLVTQAGGWPAPPQSSPYHLDLNGNTAGTIQQSFATTIGKTYDLTFYYSNNPGGSPHPATASLDVGSLSTTIQHDGATTSDLAWKPYLGIFTASSTLTTLTFAEQDNCCNGGIMLDTISVAPVQRAEGGSDRKVSFDRTNPIFFAGGRLDP
jgi:hypothetical protein